jgi:hypothetical protein
MNERTQIALKFIVSHLMIIQCLLLASFCVNNDAFLLLSISLTVVGIVFLAGYWEFLGLRFKRIFCMSAVLVIIGMLVWKIQSVNIHPANIYLVIILSFLQAYLILTLVRIVIVIFKKDNTSVEILFPFQNGTYLVTDGGNSKISRLMNYHYYSPTHRKNRTNLSMLYATDIVKMGVGQLKFLPRTNEEYPVFNEPVYSPIDGIVVKALNCLADNVPFSGDYPYNTGNTVVIQKDDHYLLLGHLKQGSIVVQEGDCVRAGDLIGSAGNSGWTERPHLHMQLIESETSNYWFGKGICIRFQNKNLCKNRIIRI